LKIRYFSFPTTGLILQKLHDGGLKITKPTLINLMKKENLFQMKKNAGGWYVCSPEEVELIVKLVRNNYGMG